jgi:hypothetical protein
MQEARKIRRRLLIGALVAAFILSIFWIVVVEEVAVVNFNVVDIRLAYPVNEDEMEQVVKAIQSRFRGMALGMILFIEPQGNQDIYIWMSGRWEENSVRNLISPIISRKLSFATIDESLAFNGDDIIRVNGGFDPSAKVEIVSFILDKAAFETMKVKMKEGEDFTIFVKRDESHAYNFSWPLQNFSVDDSEKRITVRFGGEDATEVKRQAWMLESSLRDGMKLPEMKITKIWKQKRLIIKAGRRIIRLPI